MRVGEKEVSEQAAIVARYARPLHASPSSTALRDAEDAADGDERERLYRLRATCEDGIVEAELAGRRDALENAQLAARDRLARRGDAAALRAGAARRAAGVRRPRRARPPPARGLGRLQRRPPRAARRRRGAGRRALRASPTRSRGTSEREGDLAARARARARRRRATPRPPRGSRSARAGSTACSATSAPTARAPRTRPGCGGSRRSSRRTSATAASPSASRRSGGSASSSTELPGIRLDLDDRPQKSPRACVIASDPPEVVHLITRAQGGLHDYQAFLHEAGHALHYAGCDPELPYTFRKLSRDHALTEIYSYIVEAISREPAWHAEHFGLSDEEAAANAEATTFLEAFLFRRYSAKLEFELELLVALRRRRRHRRRLRGAADRGDRPRLPGREPPRGHGRGLLLRRLPARVDPLGPAARAPPRARSARTGGAARETGDLLRDLFREGTRPVERGDRGPARLRPARHAPAARRARRPSTDSVNVPAGRLHARPDGLGRDRPGPDRRLRRRDRRPAMDPHRPGASRGRAVRDDDRARLPDPVPAARPAR